MLHFPEDCVQNCERGCRGQSRDTVGPQPIIGDDLDGRIVDLGLSSKTGAAGNHRKACWMIEFEETQCLNGGSCFAIELHNGMRRAGCRSVHAIHGGGAQLGSNYSGRLDGSVGIERQLCP